MHSVNIHNLIRLEISDDIPSLAVKQIRKFDTGPTAHDAEEDIFTIKISKRHTQTPEKTLGIDLAFKIGDNYLECSCKYKFSSWKYVLTQHSDKLWELEISGDVFSSLAWPFRTLLPLIRLILLKKGCYFFHSAGFYNGTSAVMIMAPSGTGKTLTSLHFLCSGGKVYSDDTVMLRNGKLVSTINHVNFWEYRYRKTPEVLPANMPVLTEHDKRKMDMFRVMNILSMGYVSLGLNMEAESYWPGCKAPEAKPTRIIALQKGNAFSVKEPEKCDLEIFSNRLMGDLEFQNLMLLRLSDAAKLTGKLKFLGISEFFTSYSDMLAKLFSECEFIKVTVPPRYSREHFEQLNRLIHK